MPYKRKGSDVWQIVVGGVRRTSGTTDREAAKALEDKLNLDAWKDDNFGTKPKRSWQEMCVRWKKERGGKLSFGFDVTAIRWWDTYFRDEQDIRRITRERADEIIQKDRPVTMMASPQNSTANAYVGILGSMLNAACREWDWLERAPKLRTYPKLSGRQRYLTVEEWRMLEKQLPLHLRWVATFALATGLRSAKVFKLEWQQINMAERRLTFVGNNIKRGNTIPLNDTAMAVLHEIRNQPEFHPERVFFWMRPVPNPEGYAGGAHRGRRFYLSREAVETVVTPLDSYGYAWQKAMQRAGFGKLEGCVWKGDGMTFHGLRHTFNTWMAERGVPKEIRKRLVGHSTGDVNDRYTHLNVEPLRQYAAVIDHVLAGRDVRFTVAVQAVQNAEVIDLRAHTLKHDHLASTTHKTATG